MAAYHHLNAKITNLKLFHKFLRVFNTTDFPHLSLFCFFLLLLLFGEPGETVFHENIIPCEEFLDIILVYTFAVIVLDYCLKCLTKTFRRQQFLDINLLPLIFRIYLVKDLSNRCVA